MTELTLKLQPNGQILCETEGDPAEIATMICRAMVGNPEIVAMVCGAIPTFLDETKKDRAQFCKYIMEAQGNKSPKTK